MWKYQADVMAFHRAMCPTMIGDLSAPSVVHPALRSSLINEEMGETLRAIRTRNVLETIDGLCDLLYVTIGAGITFGIDLASMTSLRGSDSALYKADRMFEDAGPLDRTLLIYCRDACEAIDGGDDVGTCANALSWVVTAIGYICNRWCLPLRPFWREVQRANMDKVNGPIRADGKRLKPPGWRGPDHLPILAGLQGLKLVRS